MNNDQIPKLTAESIRSLAKRIQSTRPILSQSLVKLAADNCNPDGTLIIPPMSQQSVESQIPVVENLLKKITRTKVAIKAMQQNLNKYEKINTTDNNKNYSVVNTTPTMRMAFSNVADIPSISSANETTSDTILDLNLGRELNIEHRGQPNKNVEYNGVLIRQHNSSFNISNDFELFDAHAGNAPTNNNGGSNCGSPINLASSSDDSDEDGRPPTNKGFEFSSEDGAERNSNRL